MSPFMLLLVLFFINCTTLKLDILYFLTLISTSFNLDLNNSTALSRICSLTLRILVYFWFMDFLISSATGCMLCTAMVALCLALSLRGWTNNVGHVPTLSVSSAFFSVPLPYVSETGISEILEDTC